jgi:DNA-binding NarL/FixJ family response regulator
MNEGNQTNSPPPIRLLLADDHQMFREGLRQVLERHEGLDVLTDAPDGRTAVRLAQELKPDVIVMDITMPGLNGIEATRQIRAARPGARVIALSMHADRQFISEALAAGASGYLLKDCPVRELINAIRIVIQGEIYLSPKAAAAVVRSAPAPDGGGYFGALTAREREILQLVADGNSSKQIAQLLGLSAKTVDTHRRQLMEKLNIDSIAGLTHFAIRQGVTALH